VHTVDGVATSGKGRTTGPVSDEALAVWADFLRFHATVTDILGRELAERGGIPLTWFDVLLQLNAAPGGRLRMQDLASAVVLSKSGLTRVVDRLADAGLVVRTTCPSDRRGTFAEITADGRSALRRARPVHLQGVAEHFAAHLDPRELATLGEALTTLLHAHGIPTGPVGGEPACARSDEPAPASSC
jgi:DNA-binding MarR family transcriptional regulator